MKNKGLLQNESRRRSGYPQPQEPECQIVRLKEKLKERNAEVGLKTRQLRVLARKLTQAEQHERRRLAGILHDHFQQLLMAARLQLSVVNRGQLPIPERNALCKADEIISGAMRDCCSLAVDLSPPILHEAGLGAALEWLARRMAELHRFTVDLDIDRRAEPPSGDLRAFLFEAMRELLFNSCKHSGCTSARVKIRREPNNWVRIVVEDGGKGFETDGLSTNKACGERFGLLSIRRRLAHLGARMELESAPGLGTRVDIVAPTSGRGHMGDRDSGGRTAQPTDKTMQPTARFRFLHCR